MQNFTDMEILELKTISDIELIFANVGWGPTMCIWVCSASEPHMTQPLPQGARWLVGRTDVYRHREGIVRKVDGKRRVWFSWKPRDECSQTEQWALLSAGQRRPCNEGETKLTGFGEITGDPGSSDFSGEVGTRWQWVNGKWGNEHDDNRQFIHIFFFLIKSLSGKRKRE